MTVDGEPSSFVDAPKIFSILVEGIGGVKHTVQFPSMELPSDSQLSQS